MLVTEHISIILSVTGGITALAMLQFFFPVKFLKLLNQIELHDDTGMFYARHWGLVVFSLGVLLMYAANHAQVRDAIILCVLIEKIGMVALIVLNRKRLFVRGLIVTGVFDGICVVLYMAYLTGLA